MRDKSREMCAHAISIYRTFKARKCDEITHIDFDRHENEKMESALREQSQQYRFYIFKCQTNCKNLTNIPEDYSDLERSTRGEYSSLCIFRHFPRRGWILMFSRRTYRTLFIHDDEKGLQ